MLQKEKLMTDLIDRQAAIETVRKAKDKSEAHRMIIQLPNVDAVRVKHGRWIPVDSYSAFGGDESTWMAHGNSIAYYYCSECKNQAYADEFGDSLLTKFCPDCGADMRKDCDKNG